MVGSGWQWFVAWGRRKAFLGVGVGSVNVSVTGIVGEGCGLGVGVFVAVLGDRWFAATVG